MELFQNSVHRVASRYYTHEQIIAWAPDNPDHREWENKVAGKSTWIAVFKNTPVGFSILEEDGYLYMLYVHADYQRMGIATALLEMVEKELRKRDLDQVHTEASIAAKPFFEKHGFRLIQQQTVKIRSQELINFCMEKRLA